MYEICSDKVDMNDLLIIYDYLKAKMRVGETKFVFNVAGHEIIGRLLIHLC